MPKYPTSFAPHSSLCLGNHVLLIHRVILPYMRFKTSKGLVRPDGNKCKLKMVILEAAEVSHFVKMLLSTILDMVDNGHDWCTGEFPSQSTCYKAPQRDKGEREVLREGGRITPSPSWAPLYLPQKG